MGWKDSFEHKKEIVLATSSKVGIPNANIVISLGFIDDKLLVANCQMGTTIENLKNNPVICVIGGYYRLHGKVEIFTSGTYFDLCVKKNSDHTVNGAILITIDTIFDLDKVECIK